MNSFQTKISGKMMRNRENKNYNFVPFLPDAEQKTSKKNCEKIQKIRKYRYGFISIQNRLEETEKARK